MVVLIAMLAIAEFLQGKRKTVADSGDADTDADALAPLYVVRRPRP
jgi:hypothetical protein